MATSDQFYLELQAEVDALLVELGTTYQVRSEGTYNEDSMTTGSTTTRSVVGIVADEVTSFSFIPNSAFEDRNPEWVSNKNLILTVASQPKENEEIQVDGKWFPLSNIKPIKPADIEVVYILDVSK